MLLKYVSVANVFRVQFRVAYMKIKALKIHKNGPCECRTVLHFMLFEFNNDALRLMLPTYYKDN